MNAIAGVRDVYDAAALGQLRPPTRDVRPRRSAQYGARAQWAEPVTGSSGTPTFGAKKRETKSDPATGLVTGSASSSVSVPAAVPVSVLEPAAVTMTPLASTAVRAGISGVRAATVSAESTSTSRSSWLFFRPGPG
ncbi:hypothetical protein GCM10020001_038010 [Nonomuraea salmonea]